MSRAPRSTAARSRPNRSAAVTEIRVEPPDSVDDFPTPPWATRALIERLKPIFPLKKQVVWEPACNRGFMARPLAEAFRQVIASDVYDYRAEWPGQQMIRDFTIGGAWAEDVGPVDWVITNPPFKQALEFAQVARATARCGFALLLRTTWLHGVTRHRTLFSVRPPTLVLPFSERVNIVKGKVAPDANKPIEYSWFVWVTDPQARQAMGKLGEGTFPRIVHIGPCRAKLERHGDYVVTE